MKALLSALVLGACLGGAVPAAAQIVNIPDDPATIDFEIVVQGERPLDRKEISGALHILTKRNGILEPLPRFVIPLCITVAGLGECKDRMIEQRIRAIAATLGLEFANNKCSPNAVVIVTDQPKKLYSTLRAKRPEVIGFRPSPMFIRDVTSATVKREIASGKPAVSWSDSIVLSMDGNNDVGPFGMPYLQIWQTTQAGIRATVQRRNAVVVFNWKKLDGVHVHQLADYATMHLFGWPQRSIPSEDVSVPTILTLFDEGPKSAPQQLTAFDRAYLCGMYDVPGIAMPNVPASRLNQNVRQAYDSNCVNAMPAAALAHASTP